MIKPNSSALRVLIVEDSLVNQKLIVGFLRKSSCDVSTAQNGKLAVERLREEDFDVVLMDVQMPLMDGITATRVIRQQEGDTASHTPIIALTASSDRESCLAAGMDDYLEKPVRRELLQLALERVLSERPADVRSEAG